MVCPYGHPAPTLVLIRETPLTLSGNWSNRDQSITSFSSLQHGKNCCWILKQFLSLKYYRTIVKGIVAVHTKRYFLKDVAFMSFCTKSYKPIIIMYLHLLTLSCRPWLPLLFLCLSLSMGSSAQIISTVAGSGMYGYSGDGGQAINASFRDVYGIAVDAVGNVYISDGSNSRIRKVHISDGKISTVAGNGIRSYGGDNGPATNASLDNPFDIDIDAAGDLFIVDFGNNRIRKVRFSDGTISTVAGNGTAGFSGDGGPATSASLNGPRGVVVDAAGNIYISDMNNNRIRKVNASDGIISTVAGNGVYSSSGDGGLAANASLAGPLGIDLDGFGNIYITDDQRIRKINVGNGIIRTVAGTGVYGYSGDGGQAINAYLGSPTFISFDLANNLYFTDFANHRIRKVRASDGIISTVAGTGTQGYTGDGVPAVNANLNYPIGIALDVVGNFYIGDFNNHRIRQGWDHSVTRSNPHTYQCGQVPFIISEL